MESDTCVLFAKHGKNAEKFFKFEYRMWSKMEMRGFLAVCCETKTGNGFANKLRKVKYLN